MEQIFTVFKVYCKDRRMGVKKLLDYAGLVHKEDDIHERPLTIMWIRLSVHNGNKNVDKNVSVSVNVINRV